VSAAGGPSSPSDEPLKVQVRCLACGRTVALDGDDVADAPLVQLTRRLVCSGCGSRAVKASRVRAPRDVARLLRSRMDRS